MIFPPWFSMIDLQTANPKPVPFWSCLVVKNGSNSFERCSFGIPAPVSEISMVQWVCPPSSPRGINRISLDANAPLLGHCVGGIDQQVKEHLLDLVFVHL